MVDAVRCAIEVQHGMIERNAGVPVERRIELRVGVHLGDVVEESDGDLMGDGVNIATRLEGIAKPNAICLSEHAYWQVKGRLDLAVQISARPSSRTSPSRSGSIRSRSASPRGRSPRRSRRLEKSAAPRLSIVVMPFANIGGGPEQEPFVDGVTESLTTDLSRIRGAVVIARNTAFTYKGRPLDVKTVGREFNVRYVLEGSVQRGANRMRVNVQLIDAEPATISGPSGSTSRSPISSTCRTKSSRAWQARSTPSSSPPRRGARNDSKPQLDGPVFSRFDLAQQRSDP